MSTTAPAVSGGFLVIWATNPVAGLSAIRSQIVAYPGRLVGPPTTIAASQPLVNRVAAAYSPTDRRFLLVWSLLDGLELPARMTPIDLLGHPIGQIVQLTLVPSPDLFHGSCGEQSYKCSNVDVAWNSNDNEFGVVFFEGPTVPGRQFLFARVRGNGTVVRRTFLRQLGLYNAFAADVEFNSQTGAYLVVTGDYNVGGGQLNANEGIEISRDGDVLSRGTLSGIIGPQLTQTLSYSPVTGTFLFVESYDGFAIELNQHGVPISARTPLGGLMLFPRATSRSTAAEWLVADLGFGVFVTTASRNGGSNALLPGCITPDPFGSLGGGTCSNRGWYPPGMLAPAPTPPPTPTLPPGPGGCSTPDPFTALGGGACSGGGWYPPGMTPPGGSPAPTPPTPGPPAMCIGPDPFISIGGGVCLAGGWLPVAMVGGGGN